MKININVPKDVDLKTISLHCKVCDSGCYEIKDDKGVVIRSLVDEYVPSIFPGEHYGDYLILDIDIETGQILNWVKPTQEKLLCLFKEE